MFMNTIVRKKYLCKPHNCQCISLSGTMFGLFMITAKVCRISGVWRPFFRAHDLDFRQPSVCADALEAKVRKVYFLVLSSVL